MREAFESAKKTLWIETKYKPQYVGWGGVSVLTFLMATVVLLMVVLYTGLEAFIGGIVVLIPLTLASACVWAHFKGNPWHRSFAYPTLLIMFLCLVMVGVMSWRQ
jgi:uncharacterized membrane protein